jgi:hypothetical protein
LRPRKNKKTTASPANKIGIGIAKSKNNNVITMGTINPNCHPIMV